MTPEERETGASGPARAGCGPARRAGGADGWSWLIDEFGRNWHDAEAHATHAYEAWRREPGPRSYAVYRARQDQADAAQDALAEWTHRISALLLRSSDRPASRAL